MNITLITFAAGAGFCMAWVLLPWLIRRSASVDGSTTRMFHQTHTAPVPRIGGLALALAFSVTAAGVFLIHGGFELDPTLLAVVFGSLACFALGFFDDWRPLGARIKLMAQVAIASAVYFAGVRIEEFANPITGEVYQFGWASLPVTVFWLVALTNLINLVDGIDGLAGGVSLMLMVLLAYVSFASQSFTFYMAVGLAAALVAFLYFNFPPARIYMGDGGAYFLGFFIGVTTIANSQKGPLFAALIAPTFALGLPILDVSLAIIRRGIKGLPLFRPDRRHIHHRLRDFGFSHRRTVLTLYAISLVFLAMGFVICFSKGQLIPVMFGLGFIVVMLSVRSFGFIGDWFSIGTVLGNSLQLRKESRYALTLSRWLEMEAERAPTLQALWKDFTFLADKLGFTGVTLQLDGGELVHVNEGAGDGLQQQHIHVLHLANMTGLHLRGPASQTNPKVFEHVCELAAEAWVKAVQRWQALHGPAWLGAPVEAKRAESFDDDLIASGAI